MKKREASKREGPARRYVPVFLRGVYNSGYYGGPVGYIESIMLGNFVEIDMRNQKEPPTITKEKLNCP